MEKHWVNITTEDGILETRGFFKGITVKEIEDALVELGMAVDEEDWKEKWEQEDFEMSEETKKLIHNSGWIEKEEK